MLMMEGGEYICWISNDWIFAGKCYLAYWSGAWTTSRAYWRGIWHIDGDVLIVTIYELGFNLNRQCKLYSWNINIFLNTIDFQVQYKSPTHWWMRLWLVIQSCCNSWMKSFGPFLDSLCDWRYTLLHTGKGFGSWEDLPKLSHSLTGLLLVVLPLLLFLR